LLYFDHIGMLRPGLLPAFPRSKKLNDYLDQVLRLFDHVQHKQTYQGSR
jgi:hypothetical protein